MPIVHVSVLSSLSVKDRSLLSGNQPQGRPHPSQSFWSSPPFAGMYINVICK